MFGSGGGEKGVGIQNQIIDADPIWYQRVAPNNKGPNIGRSEQRFRPPRLRSSWIDGNPTGQTDRDPWSGPSGNQKRHELFIETEAAGDCRDHGAPNFDVRRWNIVVQCRACEPRAS